MGPRPSSIWKLAHQTVRDFLADRPFEMAAGVSYYTLLALAPVLLLTIAIAGLFFGTEAVQGQLVEEMRLLIGEQGAEVAQTVLENAARADQGATSLAVGIATLVVGASSVFLQIQSSLNRIWNVKADPRRSQLRAFLRHRLLSMAMVFVIGFLLLVSLVVSAALSALNSRYQTWIQVGWLWQALNLLVSILVVTVLIALVFKLLPDVRLRWRDVWVGAAVTSVLFNAGKSLIGLYLGRASIGSSYGAAGSLVVLVVWVYYAALIFFAGAEITQVYGRYREKRIRPAEHAVAAPQPST